MQKPIIKGKRDNNYLKTLLPEKMNSNYLGATIIALLVIVVYFPCIQNNFIWDDDLNIYANSSLLDTGGMHTIWNSFDLYQYYPLTFTSFYIEHLLWGFNPAGYHVTSIVLHTFNAILVFFLLQELGLKRSLSLFVCLLFAIHPIQTETVAWASERKNVLSGFFYFFSFFLYIKFLNLGKYKLYGLSLFFFICALFSKTATVTLPVTLLVAEYLRKKTLTLNSLLRISLFIVPAIIMGAITAYVEAYRAGAIGEEWNFSLMERIIIISRVLIFYAQKIILPINLCFIYPKWQLNTHEIWSYWPVLLLLVTGLAFWWLRKRLPWLIYFALCHYVVSLLPTSGIINFYFMKYAFVQNHFQYFAGLGIMIIIGVLGHTIISRISIFPARINGGVLLAIALLAGSGFTTYSQCKIYQNNKTLWLDTISKNQESWMPYYNLGKALVKEGKLDEGITCYQKSIALKPPDLEPGVHNNLGNVYYEQGRLDEAISEYKRALTIDPNDYRAHNNMGIVLAKKGRLDEAIFRYKKALAINKNYMSALNNLGIVFSKQGRLDEAISQFKQVLSIDPNYAKAHMNIALAYYYRGDYTLAITHGDTVEKLRGSVSPQLEALLMPYR